MALPLGQETPARKRILRFLFLGGRWMVYGLLGAMVGMLGQGISWLGGQKLLLMLVVLVLFVVVSAWNLDWARKLRTVLQRQGMELRREQPFMAFFLLGMGNGFLPCGLVYGVLSQAALTDSALEGAALMVVFGVVSSWWHGVLLLGARVPVPRIPILQILASPRGSLALVTVFLVFRLVYSPTRLPEPPAALGAQTEHSCGPNR
jgi:hypothetical protein